MPGPSKAQKSLMVGWWIGRKGLKNQIPYGMKKKAAAAQLLACLAVVVVMSFSLLSYLDSLDRYSYDRVVSHLLGIIVLAVVAGIHSLQIAQAQEMENRKRKKKNEKKDI